LSFKTVSCLRLPARLLGFAMVACIKETSGTNDTASSMESEPMLALNHVQQQSGRSWRHPVALGLAYALLCAAVVMWASSSRVTPSSRVDAEKVELDALWNGGPVPLGSKANLRHAGKTQAEADIHTAAFGAANVQSALDLRELEERPGSLCKSPPPANVVLDSGRQCQQSMLYSDRVDGSIIAINVHITAESLFILNNAPKAGKYVPCSVTVNWKQADEVTTVGGRCRYKGSTGSFMGCLNDDDQADIRRPECRMLSLKVKVNKDMAGNTVLTTTGKKAKKVLNTKEVQLAGLMHDDSLLRNHLGYKILQWNDIMGSCTVPANLYYNGVYQGVADLMEPVDDYYLEKREALTPWSTTMSTDPDDGDNTLWKEMWPMSPDPNFYKHVQPIPDFAARELKNTGSAGPSYDLYANFYRAASECFITPTTCTKSKATQIVEKYTHPDSFIDGIVGMTLSANSDQPILIKHNFFFYVFPDSTGENKFFYISWDYNQVLYDVTGSPIPGYALDVPWHKILSEEEKKQFCPYAVPSDSDDLSVKRFSAFTCEPIGYVMALAWKDEFEARIKAVDKDALVKELNKEVETWNKKIKGSVNCDALNGGWPPSSKAQEEASLPLSPFYDQTIGFWQAVEGGSLETWPSPTFSRFASATTACLFDGIQAFQYLGHAGIQIADSVRDCRHGVNGAPACSASISNVISSFGFFSSFLSSVLTECPIQDSMGFAQRGIGKAGDGQIYDGSTDCAAQSSRLIAGLAAVSAGASGLSEMCVPGVAQKNRQRRLDMVGFEENRATQNATCTFDIIGTIAYLGRAGTAIDFATEACKDYWWSGAKCSAQVTAVIESVSYIAMYLSSAVAQCAKEINLPIPEAYRATCAADISELNGGLLSVASGGSGMASSCGVHWPQDLPYDTRSLTEKGYLKEIRDAKLAWHDWLRGDRSKVKELVERHTA